MTEINGWGVNDAKEDVLKALIEEFNRSKCNNMIISSEILRSFYNNKNAAWFFSEMREVFDNIKIIVYLRRQDKWLESLYNQNIKDPVTKYSGTFEDFTERMNDSGNYTSLLQDWMSIIPRDNIIVMFYKEMYLGNENIFKEFLGLFGLDDESIDEFTLINKRVNVSLNAAQLGLIKKINSCDIGLEERRGINEYIISNLKEESSLSECYLDREGVIMKKYTEINLKLMKMLGIDKLW